MIDPLLEFRGRKEGGAVVALSFTFSDFDKAIEFNALIVEFLKRELERERAEIGGNPSNSDEQPSKPDGN